ncbi:SCP-like extracellular [Paenibacillus sp. FSL A5-0031]|uniref:CAP domain-containing protein n=1 Tax=Paenibacillus sp. FSL A5-0031 TaxID=1920420 RepID=UPI00096EDF47|nr:CAP domain-containing protein [Paenibacillus sp. FSL A5-0031]OME85009.1 SCP-like extracellular [Paenibacillus sp. FSL A5-0031]
MKMQPIRVGVAGIIAATVIGAGFTAPTAGAAPAVKTFSTIQQPCLISQDTIKQIGDKYGIDFSKLLNGSFIQWPTTGGNTGTVTKPGTGTGTVTNPGTGTGTVTKPGTGTGTVTKPGTGTGTVTKPGTGTGTVTKPGTGTGTVTKPGTGTGTGTGTETKPGTGTDTGASNLSAYQSQVVDLVNKERAKAGLSALKSDTLLTKVASEKARDMDVNNYFSHTSPTYGSPFDMMRSFGVTYSYAGENIASGQKTPQDVMTAWMNSPGHKANILSGNFTKIGVGYVNGEWVQMFIG